MKKIKLLIFDVGNTLIDYSTYFRKVDRKILKKFWNIDGKQKDIEKIVYEIDKYLANKNLHLSNRTFTRRYFAALLKFYKIPLKEFPRYAKETKKYDNRAGAQLFSDVIPTLKKVQNKYILATLANVHDSVLHQKVLKNTKLHPIFHLHVDSDTLGFRKPHRKNFKTVLEHFHVKPEEAVMIGDNVSADIFGAKRLGINTVLINRRKFKYQFSRQNKPDFEITSLHKLPAILNKIEDKSR
jgi:2-haloalkanoic acid dehalogenase type II